MGRLGEGSVSCVGWRCSKADDEEGVELAEMTQAEREAAEDESKEDDDDDGEEAELDDGHEEEVMEEEAEQDELKPDVGTRGNAVPHTLSKRASIDPAAAEPPNVQEEREEAEVDDGKPPPSQLRRVKKTHEQPTAQSINKKRSRQVLSDDEDEAFPSYQPRAERAEVPAASVMSAEESEAADMAELQEMLNGGGVTKRPTKAKAMTPAAKVGGVLDNNGGWGALDDVHDLHLDMSN